MSYQNEFHIYFPWKNNIKENLTEKTIVDDFHGVKFVGSLIKEDSENPKLGIRITAESNKKFSIDSSFDILISKRSVKKKYTISDRFIFSNDDDNTIFYPGIYVSEIDKYLSSKDDKYYIKVAFYLTLSFQNSSSKQRNLDKTEKTSKIRKKNDFESDDNNEYTEDSQENKKNRHKTTSRNNKVKITTDQEEENLDPHHHKNKIAKKSKSQNQIPKDMQSDYSEERSNDHAGEHKSHKTKSSTSNKPHRNTQSQVHNKKKRNNDYDNDADDEYSDERQSRTTKSHKIISKNKNNNSDYSDYESEERHEKTKKSNRKQNDDDYSDQAKNLKNPSKRSQSLIKRKHKDDNDDDFNQIPKVTKKNSQNLIRHKHDDDYSDHETKQAPSKKNRKKENEETETNQKNLNKRQTNSTHHSSKKANQIESEDESYEYESENKQQKLKRKSKSETQMTKKRHHHDNDYDSDEKDKQKRPNQDSNDENIDIRKKNHSKSDVMYRKKSEKEDDKSEEEEKIPKKRRSQSSVKKNDNEKAQRERKEPKSAKQNEQTEKEEENEPKQRRTSKPTKKNEEENKNLPKNEEENEPKQRRTSKPTKKNEEENKNSPKNEEENEQKQRRTSKPTKKNDEEKKSSKQTTNDDDNENDTKQRRTSKPTKKNDEENDESETSPKENQKDDNHIITEETCPFIGLSNLGATCYMNSAIQVLFHTPLFRKNVLMYDTGITDSTEFTTSNDASSKSKRILFNLQYLFYQMLECMKQQSNHKLHKDYISTAPLTKSFGWNQQEVSLQQDVHEFIINFFEVLDTCTKKTNPNNNDSSITGLFKGRNITTITNKKDGKIVLHSFEYFYDFSLLVKGNNNIYDSLSMFTEKDDLKGSSNDQEIQVQFYSLPKVLHIHLRRFVYSQEHCRTDKVNDYFSFPDDLDMSPYVFKGDPKENKKTTNSKKKKKGGIEEEEILPYKGECNYSLYGVIVHQGKMSYIGHYYAYLKLDPDFNNDNYNFNPKDENWYLFNDTKVSKVTKEEATKLNFGWKEGQHKNNESLDDSDFHCAYILLYVRKDVINEIFNIKNSDIKIPKNVISCINSVNNKNNNNSNNNKGSNSMNSFTNVCTNATVGFTLITEDCIRMNCKLGKAGIDNRNLSKRINVPFDQIFTFKENNENDSFEVGGLYATISVFLSIDLFRLRLWTVTSSYEIGEPLSRTDFEITKEMPSEEIEQIKNKAVSLISPRVIFVEVIPFESYTSDGNDETEETEESSSNVKHSSSVVTKLYTRETQCPMLYTGILTNLSFSHSVNSLIKHHYKKQLLEISASNPKERKACKQMINKLSFDVFYEKKRSNIKDDTDLYKLNPTKSLKNNNVPEGAFLIFSISQTTNNSDDSDNDNDEQIVEEEMIIRWMNDLIVKDKSLHNNYDFKSEKNTISTSSNLNRYCDMMVTECPASPIDFCNLFTNTETFDVYRFSDNVFFGKVEVPNRMSINKLSDFISFIFIRGETKDTKMLFFSDGPALRPIECTHNSSSSSSLKSDSALFQLTEIIRKSFYFETVPRNFKYSDTCFTLSVVFSADSVSLTKKFNFFVETFSMDQNEINEADNQKQQQQTTKQKTSKKETQVSINAESFDDILKKVIDLYTADLNPTKKTKPITLNDLRCFWVSKETGQIVSDFIPINSKKKKNYISERDILMNRELRVEIIPKEQMSEMKSINKSKQKSKTNDDFYCGVRLEVYKSYVQVDYDGYDEIDSDEADTNIDGNNKSLPLLKVFDFPFVLVNVDAELKVKKLKDLISHTLASGDNNPEKTDYLSIKFASLFIPQLDKNLFNMNQQDSAEFNESDDDDDYEEDNKESKKNATTNSLIKDDYSFALDASAILKNDEKIHLLKNQPNKLFLVYSQDRALGNANEGVVFFK